VRYYVTIGADAKAQPPGGAAPNPRVIDVTELPNGTIEVQVDGRQVDIDVVPIGGQLSVRVDGLVIDLTTRGTLPDLDVSASGHRSRVRVESEWMRSAGHPGKNTAAGSGNVVRSPMPGRVVRVLVAKGESVKASQSLVVLEAMKMENEVHAHAAGTVAEIHVAAGAAVERNAPLVTLA
jgi:glutaconyl-CoA/methylmalonyl-CoA decarboxylase subunit gamma